MSLTLFTAVSSATEAGPPRLIFTTVTLSTLTGSWSATYESPAILWVRMLSGGYDELVGETPYTSDKNPGLRIVREKISQWRKEPYPASLSTFTAMRFAVLATPTVLPAAVPLYHVLSCYKYLLLLIERQ